MSRTQHFYDSLEWTLARSRKLLANGSRCDMCFATPSEGCRIEVHHIKGLDKHWHLRTDQKNLQILCRKCHMGLHWLAWGIKMGAANESIFKINKPIRINNPNQLELF